MEAYKCIIIPILGTVQCDNKAELNLWKKKKKKIHVKLTDRKWQECRVFLKTAILVQKMFGVEGPGSFPVISFQHRVQKGNDHSVLLRELTMLAIIFFFSISFAYLYN